MPDVETIRVVIPDSKIVKINVVLPGSGGGGGVFGPQNPHFIFAGPSSGSLLGLPSFRAAVEDDLPFAAMLDKPNVFTRENTIPGLRIGTRTITADYNIQTTDFEILADATGGDILINLPTALGTGQIFRVKRIDSSSNAVMIQPQSGDLIDGQLSIVFLNQFDDLTVLDADINTWDKFGSIGGGILPSDLARLSVQNIFTNVNTFTGIQFATRTITSDDVLTPLDYEVLVDATAGPVTLTLPASAGNGQTFHVKKIDDTDNVVTIAAVGSDLIDGSISLNLTEQWADAFLIDGSIGYWDNIGGAPLDIPPTLDIARLSLPNVFTDVNTFPGLRIGTKIVTVDYTLTHTDYEIVVDASGGNIVLTLPAALATGQLYRIKRIDASSNTVTLQADGTDLIDGDASVAFTDQFQVSTFVDAATGFWDKGLFIPPFILPSDLALLNSPNIFTDLNTFTGIQIKTQTVTTDYLLTPLDFELLVDATAGPITVSLPPATGTGQIFHIKKIDSTDNIVTVAANGSDLIDGSISVNFADQWADAELIDASPGYWDNTGASAGGAGGSADFGINGRVRDLSPIKGFAFDVFDGTDWIEQIRYTEPSTGPSPVTRVSYWYNPDITDLATLKAFPTIGNMLLSRLDALYNAASDISGQLSFYLLKSGAASGVDPGQVAPDDYDGTTNNVHWEQAA
jgi:hypothetical protein